MLARRIIPCLDVKDGRVVKGTKFLDLRDAGDPAEVAARYEEEGADELVFLDITASHERRGILLDVVSRTAEKVFMPLTVGGGIRTIEDIRSLLRAGADKVSINSAAVKDADFVKKGASRFGSQCIVVAIDAKRVYPEPSAELPSGLSLRVEDRPRSAEGAPEDSHRWEVYIHGGRIPVGRDAVEWAIVSARNGAGEILLTSMDKDGTQDGYDVELTSRVADAVSVPVVASGGAGSPEHLYRVLSSGKADAALAASIFHYRMYTIGQVKEYLKARGVPVRL